MSLMWTSIDNLLINIFTTTKLRSLKTPEFLNSRIQLSTVRTKINFMTVIVTQNGII